MILLVKEEIYMKLTVYNYNYKRGNDNDYGIVTLNERADSTKVEKTLSKSFNQKIHLVPVQVINL